MSDTAIRRKDVCPIHTEDLKGNPCNQRLEVETSEAVKGFLIVKSRCPFYNCPTTKTVQRKLHNRED